MNIFFTWVKNSNELSHIRTLRSRIHLYASVTTFTGYPLVCRTEETLEICLLWARIHYSVKSIFDSLYSSQMCHICTLRRYSNLMMMRNDQSTT